MKKPKSITHDDRARYVLELAQMMTSQEMALFACGLGPPPAMPKKPRLPSPEHELSNLDSTVATLENITDWLYECIGFVKKGDWQSAAWQLDKAIGVNAYVNRELRRLRKGRGPFSKQPSPRRCKIT